MTLGRPTKYKPEYCDLAHTILAGDEPWCEVARVLQVFLSEEYPHATIRTKRFWDPAYSV